LLNNFTKATKTGTYAGELPGSKVALSAKKNADYSWMNYYATNRFISSLKVNYSSCWLNHIFVFTAMTQKQRLLMRPVLTLILLHVI